MDLALIFFLPLLGGYVFIRSFVLTRYRSAREEISRVYYRAALAGCILAALGGWLHGHLQVTSVDYRALLLNLDTKVLAPLLDKADAPPSADAATNAKRADATRARSLIAMVCVWGFVLGLATPLWNGLLRLLLLIAHGAGIVVVALLRRSGWQMRPMLSPLEWLNRRSITDELERLLYVAMVRTDPLQVSLDNNKVYVGVVTSIDPVGPAKHFTMQPMMSGGRNSNDRDVIYTSFYDKIIAQVQNTAPAQREELLRRFSLVVPLARIVTASGFDFDAYKRFAMARAIAKPRFRLTARGETVLAPPAMTRPRH